MKETEQYFRRLLDISEHGGILDPQDNAGVKDTATMHDTNQLTQFYLACRVRNLRDKTILTYSKHLASWLKGAHRYGKHLDQLDIHDVRRCIWQQMERGLSPATINGRIRVGKLFWSFLYNEGEIEANPFTRIKLLKTDDIGPPALTEGQLRAVLSSFNPREFHGSRNRNVALVLLDSMIRVGELCNIKMANIDMTGGTINIPHTKSRRKRTVPISWRTIKDIHSYITRFRRALPDPDNGYLFCYDDGRPMTEGRVGWIFSHLGHKLGFRLYPHLLRHTGARMYIKAGGNVRVLCSQLGHSDIRVTMRYSEVEAETIKLQHDRYSPVANIGA